MLEISCSHRLSSKLCQVSQTTSNQSINQSINQHIESNRNPFRFLMSDLTGSFLGLIGGADSREIRGTKDKCIRRLSQSCLHPEHKVGTIL